MAILEKIPEPLVGERLDRVVAMIAFCTRAQAVTLIEAGNVSLSGKVVSSKSHKVQKNQEIIIDSAPLFLDNKPLADSEIQFSVVYEDEDICVVDKPAGLVVHPGSGNESGTLVNGLLSLYPQIENVGQAERPGIVHRLDKNTSGLMIVALSERAYDELITMMSEHDVDRIYLALVHGRVESERGIIDAPIGRSVAHATQMAVSSAGRQAITGYQVLSHFTLPMEASLCELTLETGRTHQIRVHMKAIDHPVVGDDVYSRRNSLGLKRIFLHSSKLNFTHPVSGEKMEFRSELPRELAEFLELME